MVLLFLADALLSTQSDQLWFAHMRKNFILLLFFAPRKPSATAPSRNGRSPYQYQSKMNTLTPCEDAASIFFSITFGSASFS